MGRRIVDASRVREDSDYDDEFLVDSETTEKQIETAKELTQLVENFLIKNEEKEE